MTDLKPTAYIEAEPPPIGVIPGRVTELQRVSRIVKLLPRVAKGDCHAT
ncbi:hypothetical protein [Paenibacillus glucanolyticus]|nr:hypothetical protein [Paenibacillus glucanolyticus]